MEFDLSNHIGEKNLHQNIISKMLREIDLMFVILTDYVKLIDGVIRLIDFEERLKNVQTHSVLLNNYEYDEENDEEFIDSVLDVDKVINEFRKMKINRKDIVEVQRYYRNKLREFEKKGKLVF